MNYCCGPCGVTGTEAFYASQPYRCKACTAAASREWKRLNVPRGEKFHLRKQGLLRCTRCLTTKAATGEFFIVVDGVSTSPCRECWNRERREAYVPRARKSAQGRDPIKRAASKKARKARERGAEISDFTSEQWSHLKAAFKQRCAYCHQAKPLTMDHVIPLSRGGNHTASNIVPACKSCNSRKNAGPPPIFQPALVLG